MLPGDQLAVERGEPVRPERRIDVARGQAVAAAIFEMQGGEGAVSEARRVLVADVGRLETFISLVVRRALTVGDSEAIELATRAGSLIGQRARVLAMLGLEPRRVERDLGAYLAERAQAGVGAAIDAEPVQPAGRLLALPPGASAWPKGASEPLPGSNPEGQRRRDAGLQGRHGDFEGTGGVKRDAQAARAPAPKAAAGVKRARDGGMRGRVRCGCGLRARFRGQSSTLYRRV